MRQLPSSLFTPHAISRRPERVLHQMATIALSSAMDHRPTQHAEIPAPMAFTITQANAAEYARLCATTRPGRTYVYSVFGGPDPAAGRPLDSLAAYSSIHAANNRVVTEFLNARAAAAFAAGGAAFGAGAAFMDDDDDGLGGLGGLGGISGIGGIGGIGGGMLDDIFGNDLLEQDGTTMTMAEAVERCNFTYRWGVGAGAGEHDPTREGLLWVSYRTMVIGAGDIGRTYRVFAQRLQVDDSMRIRDVQGDAEMAAPWLDG